MKINKKSLIALAIFVVFGTLFGIFTNLIFENFMSSIWTPLAMALYFLAFAIMLSILVIIVVRKLGHNDVKKLMIRDMAILLVVVFAISMLFEFLYELGLNVEIAEPDSYILMIDDSGSMESSDPGLQREKAVSSLLQDKPSSFSYAIYTFSNGVEQVREMLPKSAGYKTMDLKTDGGTAMFGCLEQVLSDISTGKLKKTSATRVLLLSDGYAGDAPLMKSKLLKGYIENNIVISTIGLGSGVDESTMKQIAEYTGGVYIHIDDASMLDTAMIDASVQSSTRNLLGYRGFCTTNTLHAILRVVFLLIIIALIYILKIYSYGKYYNPNLIISGILCVIAGILPELALEQFFWNDNLVRILFCVLISVTLVECIEPIINKRRTSYIDEYDEEDDDLDDSKELSKEEKNEERSYNSLR